MPKMNVIVKSRYVLESSTPHATKQLPIHKSPSPIIPSYINGVMSSSLRHSSTYGPSVNNGKIVVFRAGTTGVGGCNTSQRIVKKGVPTCGEGALELRNVLNIKV
jgi:hypothetical protein